MNVYQRAALASNIQAGQTVVVEAPGDPWHGKVATVEDIWARGLGLWRDDDVSDDARFFEWHEIRLNVTNAATERQLSYIADLGGLVLPYTKAQASAQIDALKTHGDLGYGEDHGDDVRQNAREWLST